MALTQKLLLRQSQALVMTPQLMQAIKLLQLSHLDLASYVEGEMERNPLLDRPAEQESGRGDPEGEAGAPLPPAAEGASFDPAWLDDLQDNSCQSGEERFDTDPDNVFPDDAAAPPPAPMD